MTQPQHKLTFTNEPDGMVRVDCVCSWRATMSVSAALALVEATAERIEDANIARILRMSVSAALENAGLTGEIIATVKE